MGRKPAALSDRVDPQQKPLPPRKEGGPASKDKMQGQDMREVLYRKFGADLTAIEGIGVATALVVLTEVGPNVAGFKTEKHFCSWLGLFPDNRISGGRILSNRTPRGFNPAPHAFRMAALT